MFDPRTESINNPVQPFDPLKPINDNYGALNFDSQNREKPQNLGNYRYWDGGGLQFKPDVKEDESGVCSPPLWGTKSASQSPVHSKQYDNNFPNLSPKSRTEAINRGRLELMEMVKAMPESSYELSLKDLVDNYHRPVENIKEEFKSLSKKSGSKIERKPKIVRSGSNMNENNKGLFLKMVFPVSFRGSNKKKTNIINNPYSRVLSKSSTTSDVDDKSSKFVDKEWWKKRSSVSDESESGGMSGSSGSSSSSSISSRSIRSNSTRKKSGCLNGFAVFYSKKSKSVK